MFNIENTENNIKKIDSLLTTLTAMLKKHWKIILLLLVIGFGYLVWNMETPNQSTVEPSEEVDEYYEDDEYYEEDENSTVDEEDAVDEDF